MSYITAIGTANPPHQFKQKTIATFMEKVMQLDVAEARRLHAIFRASGIDYRYSVLEDYGKDGNYSFYANTPDFEPFPSTEERLHAFRSHALNVCITSVEDLMQTHPHVTVRDTTHLIVVCCTGMYAPGLDIDLIQHFRLSTSVQRTNITFMGCYAAFNALKVADAFCKADAQANVLVVCVELCSLHFQKTATDDNLLANALFADGAASVWVQGQPASKISLQQEAFHTALALEGQQDMAWQIGNFGFEMKLSTYVPEIIENGIANLTKSLLAKIQKDISAIRYFAVHPGGRKILEAVQQALGITSEQNRYAFDVLRNYGNMSSPTVLFVLNEIFKRLSRQDEGEHILSFAFGPGLTMESMLLKIHTHA